MRLAQPVRGALSWLIRAWYPRRHLLPDETNQETNECYLCRLFLNRAEPGKFSISTSDKEIAVHLCVKHATSAHAVMKRKGMID